MEALTTVHAFDFYAESLGIFGILDGIPANEAPLRREDY